MGHHPSPRPAVGDDHRPANAEQATPAAHDDAAPAAGAPAAEDEAKPIKKVVARKPAREKKKATG